MKLMVIPQVLRMMHILRRVMAVATFKRPLLSTMFQFRFGKRGSLGLVTRGPCSSSFPIDPRSCPLRFAYCIACWALCVSWYFQIFNRLRGMHHGVQLNWYIFFGLRPSRSFWGGLPLRIWCIDAVIIFKPNVVPSHLPRAPSITSPYPFPISIAKNAYVVHSFSLSSSNISFDEAFLHISRATFLPLIRERGP